MLGLWSLQIDSPLSKNSLKTSKDFYEVIKFVLWVFLCEVGCCQAQQLRRITPHALQKLRFDNLVTNKWIMCFGIEKIAFYCILKPKITIFGCYFLVLNVFIQGVPYFVNKKFNCKRLLISWWMGAEYLHIKV